ncbi:MAG: hypothetical protein NVSMB42_10410 [Herpetosiphon sp.]
MITGDIPTSGAPARPAIDASDAPAEQRPHELVLAISDVHSGRNKIQMRLPVSLATVALREGARFLPPGHHHQLLLEALEQQTTLELSLFDKGNDELVTVTIQ